MGIVEVEAGGDAAVTFEPAKAAFDTVALLVEFHVVWNLLPTVGLGGNDRLHILLHEQFPECVGVITPVDHRLIGQ